MRGPGAVALRLRPALAGPRVALGVAGAAAVVAAPVSAAP